MWFNERYTLSRGRSAVPCIFCRMRKCTRWRITFLCLIGNIYGLPFLKAELPCSPVRCLLRAGLADLLLQALAHITHALVLVRIRLTQGAHVGGHLAYLLAVDAAHRQGGLFGVDGNVNARGQGELDRVREAQGKDDGAFPFELGAI